jgi:hypothetical protein
MKNTMIKIACMLALLLIGGFAAGFASQSNETLVVTCLDQDAAPDDDATGPFITLPASLFCTYLKSVRNPDPNAPESTGHPQTLFGFTIAGHFTFAGRQPGNQRSLDLIEHFIDRGVDWDKPADRALTPLHFAVLERSAPLVKRFLAAGANPRIKMHAPGKPLDGLDAFDFARFLRTHGKGEKSEAMIKGLLQVEDLLCDDPSVDAHARTQAPNIKVDSKTHKVVALDWVGDHNPYPADNYDQIEGGIEGPLGDQTKATLAFASVWDFENVRMAPDPCKSDNDPDCAGAEVIAPSRLEVMLLADDPNEGEDGPPRWFHTFKLPSQQDRPGREARLLSLQSVTIEDVDGDGHLEVRASARFAIGCGGKPFDETLLLKISGDQVTRFIE